MNTKEVLALARIMEQVQMNSKALNFMSQESSQMMKGQQLKISYYKCRDTGWILIDKKDTASLGVSCECNKNNVSRKRGDYSVILIGRDKEEYK